MSQANEFEQLMLSLINEERATVGLDPLRFNGDLNEAAEDHSDWMLDTDQFSHTGQNGSSVRDRTTEAGYELEGRWAIGENIGWQSERGDPGLEDDVADIHQSLMNSPGHRANILSDSYDEIGIGIERGDFEGFDGVMITQNFGSTDAEPDVIVPPVDPTPPAPEAPQEPEVPVAEAPAPAPNPVPQEPEPVAEQPQEPEVPVVEMPEPTPEPAPEEPQPEQPVAEAPDTEEPMPEPPAPQEPQVPAEPAQPMFDLDTFIAQLTTLLEDFFVGLRMAFQRSEPAEDDMLTGSATGDEDLAPWQCDMEIDTVGINTTTSDADFF